MKQVTIPISNHISVETKDRARPITFYVGDSASDEEIAAAAAAAVAMSEGGASGYTVTQYVALAAPQAATAPGTGHKFARVTNRLEFTLRTSNHKAPAKIGIPAPKEAILDDDQTIDEDDALVSAFTTALLAADGQNGGNDLVNSPAEFIGGELFINN
jgi:hypothetical protein